MKRLSVKRLLTALSASLFALGMAAAQDIVHGADFDFSNVQPIGEVQSEFEAYENGEDAGAIVLTHTTPGDQHADFDVVGPDGYYEHFDFSDDQADERVLEDLTPGVYSIAATDSELNLVHTIVEVRAGEATRVHSELSEWQGAAEGEYDARETYGTYEGMGEDAQPGYPYGAYTLGGYEPYDEQDRGAIVVEGLEDDTELVVTGPNDFSTSVTGDDEVTGLEPGTYVLAGTGEGMDLSVTTVQVRAGEQLTVDPGFVERQGQQDQQDGQNEG